MGARQAASQNRQQSRVDRGKRRPSLDSPVKDVFEMIEKLAGSERAEQVFVRHIFHFGVGGNETIDDAPVLKEAPRVYRESRGSFRALLLSIVSSDAFLYTKR